MARGRIPDSDVEAIRERANIADIVGEYVQLKPAGHDSLKGLSPFKDEKTPSFHVRPARGYYHCFSTGKGGDVFSFLMEMEQLSFPEAVEAVAEEIGYHINYQGGTTGARDVKPGTRSRLLAANKAAHEFYREQLELEEAEVGRRFLLDRGFDKDTIYHFECGYAPNGWDAMTKHLLRKGFDAQELQDAGLSSMGRRGPIDKFRGRLLWPIKDVAGNVIGFGARKLFDDDPMGKYINTADTMLYHKSKVLFGLDLAKKHIAAGHQAVVVEGYTDVMAMHAAGIHTAVAACGTAFGSDHMAIIRRLMLDDNFFRGELIYTFDGDEAGQKAAMRAFEGDQQFTGQSFVAIAPEGMDPCDLRLAKGDAAVRDLIARRIPMFEFVIDTLLKDFPLDTPEGRLQALRRTVPVVAQIKDAPLRTEYARQLAGWVGWPDPNEVIRQVREEARNPRSRKPNQWEQRQQWQQRQEQQRQQGNGPAQRPSFAIPAPDDPRLWAQREAIKLGLQYPHEAGLMFDQLGPDAYSDPAYQAVRHAIAQAGGVTGAEDGPSWIAAVAGQMIDLNGRNFVAMLAVEEILVQDTAAYAESVMTRLKEVQVGNQIAQLKSRLQRMRPTDDEMAYNALFSDLVKLEQERRELNERAFRN
ncbi:DNA primase [Corynebacterium aquatimens]|uniref:DNA primase n=1 Tax=Corynebacterium aquatimens TaxID=1190508 RepID=A0A931E1I9_9CORY|nr:DNA primase [Corynebacterium aquatimens]MBG6122061.1 DNA primase [Corynebacterium aquatimens]WJY65398.1 DNA primase [Corynebacterium aquatimens]